MEGIIGKLNVEIAADLGDLINDLNDAKVQTQAFGHTIGQVGESFGGMGSAGSAALSRIGEQLAN